MTVKKNDISFEEALKDLEKIVEDLNNGDMELEKAITAYEKESNRRPIQRAPQFNYEGIPITYQKR